jgi:NAD(P)-dependent dehydrogenase (short-subunit alcohol dehydrogenase family)
MAQPILSVGFAHHSPMPSAASLSRRLRCHALQVTARETINANQAPGARARPQDVVGAAVFLCAAESDFITGQTRWSMAERRCTDPQHR